MTPPRPRNDFATVALVLALGGLILLVIASKLSSKGLTEVCVGVGAAAMVMGGMGLRHAVRTDHGVARTLFGLGFGFLALVLATIVLGGQKGAVYSGLGPATAHHVGRATTSVVA